MEAISQRSLSNNTSSQDSNQILSLILAKYFLMALRRNSGKSLRKANKADDRTLTSW
jgi:hypothetical protein